MYGRLLVFLLLCGALRAKGEGVELGGDATGPVRGEVNRPSFSQMYRTWKRVNVEAMSCRQLKIHIKDISFNKVVNLAGVRLRDLGYQHSMAPGLEHTRNRVGRKFGSDLDVARWEIRCQAARDSSDIFSSKGMESTMLRHILQGSVWQPTFEQCYTDFSPEWTPIGRYSFHDSRTDPFTRSVDGKLRAIMTIPVQRGQTALQCGFFNAYLLKTAGKPIPWAMFRVSLTTRSTRSDQHKVVPIRAYFEDPIHFIDQYEDAQNKRTPVRLKGYNLKINGGTPLFGPSISYVAGHHAGSIRLDLQCGDQHPNIVDIVLPRPTYQKRVEHGKGPTKAFAMRKVSVRGGIKPKCPIVLSHRAVRDTSSPENTIYALKQLMETSIDGAELDVFLVDRKNTETGVVTKIPVLAHDPDLTRILGVDAKLNDVLASKQYSGLMKALGCQGLQPLQQVLAAIDKHRPDMFLDIELKPGEPAALDPYKGYSQDLGRRVGEVLRKFPRLLAHDRIVVSSFDSTKTRYVNEGFVSQVRTAGATYTSAASKVAKLWNRLVAHDPHTTAHVYHYSQIDYDTVAKHHGKKQSVGAYTLYDFTEPLSGDSYKTSTVKKLLESGVDWIETDDPFRLQHMLHLLAPTVCGASGNKLPKWARGAKS